MNIRKFKHDDIDAIIELTKLSINQTCDSDYNQQQLDAWISHVTKENMLPRLQSHLTLVATIEDILVGYCDMDDTGYLDHLYVHPNYQHRHIASQLVELVELLHNPPYSTHVSITAKSFFESIGYQVKKENKVVINDLSLTNYLMTKEI